MRNVEIVLGLVVLGTVVAAFARRLRVPAPSLLVVAGIAVGLLPGVPPVRVPPSVVSFVVLPPLLWGATLELSARDLRAVWRQVLVLAVGLVLASAAAVAGVAVAVAAVPLTMAFVLGSVLASTDPVAVNALGRRLALPPRVQAVVQGESLFNDATSLVLFQVAVSFAVGGMAFSGAGAVLLHGLEQVGRLAGGGALTGAVVGGGAIVIRARITDPVLESVVALVVPYAAYVLGAALGLSGVMAVIVAGLLVGSRQTRISTAQTRLQVNSVFRTVIFVLETVVFSLIGLELPGLIGQLPQPGRWPLAALAVAGTVLFVRIVWVFPLWGAVHWRRDSGRPSWTVPAVVSWAGTRGVVPLAATLSIPLATSSGGHLPQRALVMVLSVTVIVISLLVQGFTLEPLVRRTAVAQPSASTEEEEARARLKLAEAAIARLDELAARDGIPDAVIDQLRRTMGSRAEHARAALGESEQPAESAVPPREIRRDVIAAQVTELSRLYAEGTISAATQRRLQRALDLELARLGD